MKKLFLIGALVILALSLSGLGGCGSAESEKKEARQSLEKSKTNINHKEKIPTKKTLKISVNVNDATLRQLSNSCPIYIICRLTNPCDKHTLSLKQNSPPTPFCQTVKGRAIPIKTRRLTRLPTAVPKNGYCDIAWELISPLKPGKYEIDIAADTFIALDKGWIDRLRHRSARLELSNKPATEREKAYYQRRILSLSGRYDMVLNLLQEALIQAPENLALHKEMVDTFEAAGDFSRARQQLISLGELIAERALSKNPESPPHTPYWIINRDARLQNFEKIKKLIKPKDTALR